MGTQSFMPKNQLQVAKYDIHVEKSEYTVLYAKKSAAGGEIRQVIYCFFLVIDTNPWLGGLGE